MCSHLEQEFQLFFDEILHYFSPAELTTLAKETQFVQRKSKFSAVQCIALCVWLQGKIGTASLNELCSKLATVTGVMMSAEALNQRFNKFMVAFLQELFTRLLSQKLTCSLSSFSQYHSIFQRIRVLDSTSFQLPDAFSDTFPGTGCTSLKLQLEYDLLSGQFLYTDFEPGKNNDRQAGTKRAELISSGDLCLQDIGYFKREAFQTIQEKKGYYLSRTASNTQVYFKNPHPSYSKKGKIIKKTEFNRVSLEKLMVSLEENETKEIQGAYIGVKKKFPVRLIVHRLTDEQKKQRLAKLKEVERVTGIRYSDRSKRLTGLNGYITNLPMDIPKEDIHSLYSLRWQIEILFKTWKSFLKVDKCKPVKFERLQCHIYAQFITMLVCTSIVYRMRYLLIVKKQKELSEYKAMYIVLGMCRELYEAIQKDTEAVREQLSDLFSLIQKNGLKSRQKKETALHILGVTK